MAAIEIIKRVFGEDPSPEQVRAGLAALNSLSPPPEMAATGANPGLGQAPILPEGMQ